jgi:S1-C subfamily serine protease
MSIRLVFPFVLSLGLAACPSVAQIVKAEPDARGIPTIAPPIAAVEDAVVNIAVISERPAQLTPLFSDRFCAHFLPPPDQVPPQRQMSAGAGGVVDAGGGYVTTNKHVVENAEEIHVTLRDNRSFEAELTGRDPATDIAVLRIEADTLTEVPVGNFENFLVGDFVVAIGNPFGLGQTVTSGIVSASGRSGINPEGYEDFIQTDASINPGNSGGALITLNGKLVGINTAMIAPNGGGNVGIGFALPINMALGVVDQLVEFGMVQRGRLGVMIRNLTPDLAEVLEVDAESGAVVSDVLPADDAGLVAGDVIVAVNKRPVGSIRDIDRALEDAPAPVVLSVWRDGRTMLIVLES